MEELAAASIMTLSRSAPLYLFFEVPAFQKHHEEELLRDGGGGGGFEFAAAGAKGVDEEDNSGGAPRACASDVSAYADELFRGGLLLPLKLPPRLQRPAAASSSSSAATSPTGQQLGRMPSWSPFASSRRHRGFDPFAAALEKVRRDGAAPVPRRARSLSPLRGVTTAAAARSRRSRPAGTAAAAQKASASPPCRSRRRGVKHFLCRASTAGTLRRRRDHGEPCRPGLLVCFGL